MKKIHGPSVTQKKYRRCLDELNTVKSDLGFSKKNNNELRIALDGYYETHNHYTRCECGFCDHARCLIATSYKPSLTEVEREREFRARTIPTVSKLTSIFLKP